MELSKVLASGRAALVKASFQEAFKTYTANRGQTLAKVDEETLKKRAREIKEKAVANLERLKAKAMENLRANGIKVFEAKDAEEARKLALELIPAGELVVKAKSNTINEIELSKVLEGRNEVIETDCGDFIVSLCGEASTHPVTPAIHIPIEVIIGKIEEKFGVKLGKKPEKIVEWFRAYIRGKVSAAKIGLTGANFISSDGSLIILENEGNISLISRIPEKHVVIAGIDRIVESMEDAVLLCKAATIWGTGSSIPTYINIISSPSKTADIQKTVVHGAQGAKEVDLILVDNGRGKAAESFSEILYCINCGSCLYFCPVYRSIFDSYGLHYFGGIGVSKLAFTNDLKEAFERGLFYCTTCQACKINCPVGIDIPQAVRKLREFAVKSGIEPENSKQMMENIKVYGNPFGKVEDGKIPKELYCC